MQKEAKILFLLVFISLLFAFHAVSQTSQPVFTCGATTTQNLPCKAKVKAQGGKCFNHSATSHVCGAKTASGKKCTRKAKTGLCWQHDPNHKKAEPAKN